MCSDIKNSNYFRLDFTITITLAYQISLIRGVTSFSAKKKQSFPRTGGANEWPLEALSFAEIFLAFFFDRSNIKHVLKTKFASKISSISIKRLLSPLQLSNRLKNISINQPFRWKLKFP